MKITLCLVSLNLFIFITTHSLLSTASDVIYDSTGNKLLKGVPYYILPLLRGTGGGLTLSRASKDACPLDVTQEPFDLSNGVPFTINPILFDQNNIRVAYPISIEADVADPCRGSNILKVVTSEDVVKTVTAGGQFDTPESCFQLVENDMMPGLRSYQIQYCPSKCGSNTGTGTDVICYNVGIISNSDGKRFVGLTDVMFPVVFESSFAKTVQSE
ncbi:putative proteinase inhibitor I3, Kunitz legume, kunitz inhibitor STI-like superfamily [Helianthus annuus]|nr:putative proteinase inhibitor I3, Kunitz legume, kunitz inhibitor STI-like superfamily [Helianthus annuus]KAJ0718493.1 putative proteinase inhibitor I3, Kunitz legume, kunitz inhibitor STI-like superfamily [Helianthus annuus]KAJ0721751.1 putative proteinase inhibitor I3, Kunitz legume, kunitz inhibitor STI-like superfamily [Helianthus annuus]KAJ0897004.1 putative proteinase inhibitor I3, Kunitz legume, kunitz inhibitor STI-like superfamily [Helianthus annuus]